MTREMIAALKDEELECVLSWIEDEKKERAERYKRETIAKIKELANKVGIAVNIAGVRGRPKGAIKALNTRNV